MQVGTKTKGLFILSAYRSNLTSDVNQRRHKQLKSQLDFLEITTIECDGSYNGKEERSFTLVGASLLAAHHYASAYGQDSFLRLEPHHNGIYRAFFIEVETGKEDFGGFFRSFPWLTVKKLNLDYTLCDGTYYTIWNTDTVDMGKLENEIQIASENVVADKSSIWG